MKNHALKGETYAVPKHCTLNAVYIARKLDARKITFKMVLQE